MDFVRKTILEQKHELKKLWKNKRDLAFQALNLGLIVFSALLAWKALMAFTESDSPVVVVLSGSMEPLIDRGDILFLDNRASEPITVGDIVVFKIKNREVPIVHRVLALHEELDGGLKLLTKGDNNNVFDRVMYAPGQMWLNRSDIIGKAKGVLPVVGMATIYLNDYPLFKFALVGTMGFFVLTNKE